MSNEKLYECVAAREFSNTIFGNISQGQRIKITAERRRVWLEQGLIRDDTPNIKKMTKKELAAFAKDRFDIDLDQRQTADKMCEEVQALLEVIK